MLARTMRLLPLAVIALAVACHQTEPRKAEPSAGLPTATTAAAPAPAASNAASPAGTPAAPSGNRWTTPVDCAARDTSADKSTLTPEERKRDRFNCDLGEELRVFVAARQACQSAAECTNVTGSCPFGCAIPVAASAANEVTQKLASIVERQEKAGTRCAYRCAAPEPPACVEGRCTGK